ncbi:conserved hypothetical protein [Oleispira antarctica RB-8]|uniref:Lipoprotein n=1 Tax=Oleispira antarctica RB-8 TaxID=698738 RepID=R4YN61_OLEAN|nr:conserved hypothetical protein [Oleispira antarctica RB-8]
MKSIYSFSFSFFILLFLTACSSVDITQYKENQPRLVLDQFFNGELTAHGILKNRSGEVTRYFNVTMTGTWDDQGVGTLAEKFIFNDDSIEFRTWTFTPIETGSGIQYQATANDTLAPTMIDLSGNAFFMNYDLMINYQGDDIDVNIDDKMYLINDDVIINESVMTKYGIEVAYITLTIIKTSR